MRRRTAILLAASCLLAPGAMAQARVRDGFFTTSDGVRLHYLEAGPPGARTIVLVPGWTMPAWIWGPQIAAFSAAGYHVVALDPRGQGRSEVPTHGYTPERRGDDIAELIARQRGSVLLIGWSLGVLDSLAYIQAHGSAAVAGLVLVDNSVGELPAPVPPRRLRRPHRPVSHDVAMAAFVRSMFRTPQSPAYLEELTEASLRTPEWAARALLSYPVPRSYWREAVYSTPRPVLYIVRPGLSGQAANLARGRPNTETAVFTGAGHALFVDEAGRFDTLVLSFARRIAW